MKSILGLKNVTLRIAKQTVCEDLSLSMKPGEVWGVLGKNGVGKTTFLHALSGIQSFQEGSVIYNQQPLAQSASKEKAKIIGLLPQEQRYIFPNTVHEMVMAGRHPHCSKLFGESKLDFAIVEELLTKFELTVFAKKNVLALSGGEKQRVAIATLFAQNPHVFLLDEPCNHLDVQHQIHILSELKKLAEAEKKIIIMVLHDLNLVAKFCDNVILLFADHSVKFGGAKAMLTESTLSRLYNHPIKLLKNHDSNYFALL